MPRLSDLTAGQRLAVGVLAAAVLVVALWPLRQQTPEAATKDALIDRCERWVLDEVGDLRAVVTTQAVSGGTIERTVIAAVETPGGNATYACRARYDEGRSEWRLREMSNMSDDGVG